MSFRKTTSSQLLSVWVPWWVGNGVHWQQEEGGSLPQMEELLRSPDGPDGSPRWRPGSPGGARHRHRLTTIKTKSAAVGSHEYWMGGGGARTGTLLYATQPPHLTHIISETLDTWHISEHISTYWQVSETLDTYYWQVSETLGNIWDLTKYSPRAQHSMHRLTNGPRKPLVEQPKTIDANGQRTKNYSMVTVSSKTI